MDAFLLTRQIYWSPAGGLSQVLHDSTYLWLVVAVAICIHGLWVRIRLWRAGKPEACFDRPWVRLVSFCKNVIAQARVLRLRKERSPKKNSIFAALMHGLIYYGFLALVFGTTIVGLKDYNIIDLYHGWFYAFLKVACQLGGIALVVGLGMGIFRRSNPSREYKNDTGYTLFYGLLFLLVLQGFCLQGLRLSFDPHAPDREWAFIGSLFSYLYSKHMDVTSAEILYGGLWYFHMLTTMAFIALLPYTRAMHIITSCLNLYTARLEPSVNLPLMDFENPSQEYFGTRELTDFSWKDLLSFDSCTECRRCTDICPANAVGKPLDPRNVILKLRDSMTPEALLSSEVDREKHYLFENGTITHEEIWACTNCGGCVNECPVGIDQLRTIMQLRRYQTLSLGEIPSSAGRAVENVKQYGNPWGLPQADRFKWAEGLDIPIIKGDSPEVEYLYYIGCAGAYDPANQKVVRSVVNILKFCGVDFAVMGKAEKCNGEPVRRLGDEYSFTEIARSNVEQLSQLKFKKIVTHCPHCFSTLKNDYRQFGGFYEVLHHSQLLSQLYSEGKLQLPGEIDKEVTFHDPCFLGRHNGEYEAPRKLLEAVAGLRLAEMEQSRETASCCGMGGGNMWYETEGGSKIVEERLQHVAQTGAKTLVTGCSFCLINFKSAFSNVPATKNLEVMDIAEAITLAMPEEARRAPGSN